jgi:hypothetical protein
VQTLPGTRRKGLNKVTWNLRCKPPKTATGSTKMDVGGFIAPMVLPGTYTVKMKVGDKEYSNKLTLVHDKNDKLFTEADRKMQYETAMKIYDMHEDLARLVDNITAEEKLVKDNLDSVKQPKAKKLLNEYNKKLEDLRSTLLATKHKSIFADEKKLREFLSELYTSVCYQECKPSNLQLERVTVLNNDLLKGHDTYNKLYAAYADKVHATIDGEKKRDRNTPRLSN